MILEASLMKIDSTHFSLSLKELEAALVFAFNDGSLLTASLCGLGERRLGDVHCC